MKVKLKKTNEALKKEVAERTAKLIKKTREAENARQAVLDIWVDLKIEKEKLAEEKAKLENANKKLNSLDRLKDEFISIASHELRTPLTAIDGLVSMILEGEYGKVNENLRKPLSDVNSSSERLIHLVNDLLNLSRIQSKTLKYILSDFEIMEVLNETVRLLGSIAKKKGIKLEIKNNLSATVHADLDKVKEILNNLIGNAIKFTDKGYIWIWLRRNERFIKISIEDSGVGINRAEEKKLFGKFQQLESSRGRPEGTGLGLYLSREIVQNMGGQLWLEKSEPEKGSIFTFSLPLYREKTSDTYIKKIVQ